MANHISHAALPFPVKNARFTVVLPYLDADGDPADGSATLDTELSLDNATWADAAEEVTFASGAHGMGMITLTGAETNNSYVGIWGGNGGAAKAPLADIRPRVLPVIASGTASAGAAGSLTIPATMLRRANYWNGAIVRTTGGTGGGGTGGANNQARVITGCTAAGVLSVSPNWETTPDNTTTFDLLGWEGWVGASQDLAITSGLVYGPVTAAGGSATTITLPANSFAQDDSLLVGGLFFAIAGTGVGQAAVCNGFNATTEVASLDETQSVAFDNTTQFIVLAGTLGLTAASVASAVRTEMDSNSSQLAKLGTPAGASISADIAAVQADTDNLQTRVPAALVSGRMDASVGAYQSGQAPLQPTTAGRTLDVSTGGEAGVDWANVGSPTTAVGLSGTTIGTVTSLTGNTPQTGDAYARLGAPAGASHAADVAAVKTDTGNLINRLGAWAGSGVNTVLGAFKALLSKTASTPSDIGGTFDPTTDSTEAIRDRGDAAYLTATGFATSAALTTAQTDLTTLTGRLTSGRAANLDNLNALITSRAAAGDAMTLTSGERAAIAAALLDLTDAVEAGLTPRQALRLITAVLGGRLSGVGSGGAEVFRNAVANSKDRVTATMDANKNRTAIILDLT